MGPHFDRFQDLFDELLQDFGKILPKKTPTATLPLRTVEDFAPGAFCSFKRVVGQQSLDETSKPAQFNSGLPFEF